MIIPVDTLKLSNKVLFITHLAIGDFTYLYNFFLAFKKAYPHLEIHIWVDELRRTKDHRKWSGLKRYVLYDWLKSCSMFDRVYDQTYSPQLLKQSIIAARGEAYPLVISLATLRPHFYASLARKISPHGYLVGMAKKTGFFCWWRRFAYQKLNTHFPRFVWNEESQYHVTDIYNQWFSALGIRSLELMERYPQIEIPRVWLSDAQTQVTSWSFDPRVKRLLFINCFAKTPKRSWPLDSMVTLIEAIRARDSDVSWGFVVNAIPEESSNIQRLIDARGIEQTRVFSANSNFFQLPAMLAQCKLIVSVETSIMHLANAVGVPVIALMRQKNPEWVPIDRSNSVVLFASQRRGWVKSIPPSQVLDLVPL
jgi:heptosyltransferase-3